MEFTSRIVPHYSARDGYLVHKISNDNGVEVICTPHQMAILSVRTPDSNGVLQPLLPNYQQKVDSYLSASVVFGGALGPISFPYTETAVSIGKKTHFLPTSEDKKRFRLMKWEAVASCSKRSYKITYRSISSGNGIPATTAPPAVAVAARLSSSSHEVEVELNQQNQLFTRYLSRSTAKEQFSLGHNLIWNFNSNDGVFRQKIAINASQFTATPFVEKFSAVNQSEQDYRKQRNIGEGCEGYYRLHGENITNAQHNFEKPVEKLTPAVMLSDPKSKRYLQIHTDYPCLRLALHHHKKKRGWAISLTPCVLLDMPEIFARKLRRTFRCCYQFGILD